MSKVSGAAVVGREPRRLCARYTVCFHFQRAISRRSHSINTEMVRVVRSRENSTRSSYSFVCRARVNRVSPSVSVTRSCTRVTNIRREISSKRYVAPFYLPIYCFTNSVPCFSTAAAHGRASLLLLNLRWRRASVGKWLTFIINISLIHECTTNIVDPRTTRLIRRIGIRVTGNCVVREFFAHDVRNLK